MIFSLNEKFLSNAKLKLTVESNLFLSSQKKIILNHLPLVEKEKEICLSLFNKDKLPFLLSFALTSILYDILKNIKTWKMTLVSRNVALRLLLINSFHYLFLVDNEKFYSIIYFNQQSRRLK